MNPEIIRKLVAASFSEPQNFSKHIDQKISRNRSLSSSKRRHLSNLLFDLLRWRRRIFGDISPSSLNWHQIEKFLSEAKELIRKPPLAKWQGLSMDSLAQELSFPTWMIGSWVRSFGFESAVNLALAFNQPAPICFRTNTLKTNREALIKDFLDQKIWVEKGKLTPWSIYMPKRENIRSLSSFKKGWFEFQDEGSQVTVLESQAKSGENVVDACARTGGKALALAALMKNQGEILCADSDSRPLEDLKKRAKRAGVKITQTSWVAKDDPNPLPTHNQKADLVFVDAPCSGLGTLRRKPWLKWILSPSESEKYAKTQYTLLKRYAEWVKPGGRLMYVTCTINPIENESVVKAFCEDHPEFKNIFHPHMLRPDVEGTDGFFIAMFSKK